MPIPPHPASDPASTDADRLRGRAMSQALGRLLDRARGSRQVLPHLAALERGLCAGGASVIDRASTAGLARLCSQLGSLPLPDDDAALQALSTRLMEALVGQPPASVQASPPARRMTPGRDDWPADIAATAVVEEVSHSDFLKISAGDR